MTVEDFFEEVQPQAKNIEPEIEAYIAAKRALKDVETFVNKHKFVLAENAGLKAENAELKETIKQYDILLNEKMIVVKEVLEKEVQ